MRRSGSEHNDEDSPITGLLCGITAYHVRVLCENPFDGGAGYTPEQVGDMTLDEIFMRLTDRKLLLANRRHKSIQPLEAVHLANKDGKIYGRDRDGNPIVGRIAGVSKAKQMLLAQQAKEQTLPDKQPRRGRRGRSK